MRRAPHGFTIVEILTSLLVLAIGMTATLTVIMGSQRIGDQNIDRNNALQLVPEAVAEIERSHLITKNISDVAFPGDVGLLLETTKKVNAPNVDSPEYTTKVMHGESGRTFEENLTRFCSMPCFASEPPAAATTPLMSWPFGNDPVKYFGGANKNDPESRAYRVIYRLERHPEWHDSVELPDSAYVGIYKLTLTVYRDYVRDGSRLEQVSENVVVYLRDRKER